MRDEIARKLSSGSAGERVSATEPDWSRERCAGFWDPGRRLLQVVRAYQRLHGGGPISQLVAKGVVPFYRFWSVVTGAEIPLSAKIGGGLMIPHPNGIVLHPEVEIGPNCLIFQQVTIGTGGAIPGVPRLGGHVDIGAGAKILGGVVIGDHTKIGANSVVLCDVAGGATAVGLPAKIVSAGSVDAC